MGACCSSCADTAPSSGMGDVQSTIDSLIGAGTSVPSGIDPYLFLTAQVNRYASAPAAYQYVQTPFPLVSGSISENVATAALLINQGRALDAVQAGTGTVANVANASAGFGDPVTTVNAQLAAITSSVATWADSLGLPAAQYPGAPFDYSSLLVPALIGAGILLLMWRK